MKVYYHFTGPTLRDGRKIPKKGVWLKHKGPLIPCASGLHASPHPFDALQYAPGNLLHRVNIRGEMIPHGLPVDKYVARERRIIATINAENVLRTFARKVALASVQKYWKGDPDIVIRYLKTGDESIRAAALDDAWAAALDAVNKRQRNLFLKMVNEEFRK